MKKPFLKLNPKHTSLHMYWDRWFVLIVILALLAINGRMWGEVEYHLGNLSDYETSVISLLQIANIQRQAIYEMLLVNGLIIIPSILILMLKNKKD